MTQTSVLPSMDWGGHVEVTDPRLRTVDHAVPGVGWQEETLSCSEHHPMHSRSGGLHLNAGPSFERDHELFTRLGGMPIHDRAMAEDNRSRSQASGPLRDQSSFPAIRSCSNERLASHCRFPIFDFRFLIRRLFHYRNRKSTIENSSTRYAGGEAD